MPEPSAQAADQVLDCSGLACPLPVLKTAQAIKTLAVGQILELIATLPFLGHNFTREPKAGGYGGGHAPRVDVADCEQSDV